MARPPLVVSELACANLKANRPMMMTGDRMLPALEIATGGRCCEEVGGTDQADYFGSAASKQ
jgi:hypothetical protein